MAHSPTATLQILRTPSCHNMKRQSEQDRVMALVLELFQYSHTVPLIRTVLDGILLPEANGASLTSILESAISSGGESISSIRGLDKAMATVLATLAEQTPKPSTQPRKRTREGYEAQEQLQMPKSDIGDVIHAALRSLQNNIIDQTLLTTLQLRLHAIFISSVASLTPSTPANIRDTLSKMSKLVQLLGVLSGLQLPVIPIPLLTEKQLTTVTTDPDPDLAPTTWQSSNPPPPPPPSPTTHPCPHPACLKTFQKAYDLRVHSRVHANYRPFACSSCPATFTRNHDLQRHTRSHPRPTPTPSSSASTSANSHATAHPAMESNASSTVVIPLVVQCTVCKRIFSRRDAFLRHTRGGRGKEAASRLQCSAALGETVVNMPSPSTLPRKRASRWDKSQVDPQEHTPNAEQAPFEPIAVEILDQSMQTVPSDPNNPFSIFSETDLAQIGLDLNQLLALPQFTGHIPSIEL